MQVLRWIGKPVLALLNQLGPPQPPAEERAELERWRTHLQGFGVVRDVLPLDAFARCWVQERVLLDAVGRLLPAARRDAFARLCDAWHARGNERFAQAARAIAAQLDAAATDAEPVDDTAAGTAQKVLRSLGAGASRDAAREQAMAQLLQRLDGAIRDCTARLIAVHGLHGSATQTVLARLRENFMLREKLDTGRTALWSSLVTGALTGLKADLAAGGLTFGAGMLVGGVLGGLAGAGAARGLNRLSGREQSVVRFSPTFLDGLARSAALRYLAVAHFGRGRGQYIEGEAPAFWREEVERAYGAYEPTFGAIWSRAARGEAVEPDLQRAVAELLRDVLRRLYPGCSID
jgi:hypothetical protein